MASNKFLNEKNLILDGIILNLILITKKICLRYVGLMQNAVGNLVVITIVV